MTDAETPTRFVSGEGERLWLAGSLATIVLPGEAVGGRFALIEFLFPRHISPPRHHHPQDETFLILAGHCTFEAGNERFDVEAGGTVVVPRGVPHTFRVDSDTLRMLVVSVPAGLDRLFRDWGVPASAPTLPPPDIPGPTPEELDAIFRAHRHDNVGPPLGPDD